MHLYYVPGPAGQPLKKDRRDKKDRKEKRESSGEKRERRQSAGPKRGEYRCGKCGFYPKKVKHNCADENIKRAEMATEEEEQMAMHQEQHVCAAFSYHSDDVSAADPGLTATMLGACHAGAPVFLPAAPMTRVPIPVPLAPSMYRTKEELASPPGFHMPATPAGPVTVAPTSLPPVALALTSPLRPAALGVSTRASVLSPRSLLPPPLVASHPPVNWAAAQSPGAGARTGL